jgi:LuxR family maltose regulon positive regulatory protein
MNIPILSTKLYFPPPRTHVIVRPRLNERLREGIDRKLTLVSAHAGFGKTTLVSEWIAACDRPAAWLSLDEGDNDPARFLTYLIAAVRTIIPHVAEGLFVALQSPQPPSVEAIVTALLNELAADRNPLILVLDDYHVIRAEPVIHAVKFLVEHLPPHFHLVIATREDPPLPLSRLRVRGQVTELRGSDLRFNTTETAQFLNESMALRLSSEQIDTLAARTEGWIAGLQLAALSLQSHQDADGYIRSFGGSHHFVLDYLVEEVLQQQPENVQNFLLSTSILDRMCGPLCDAVLGESEGFGQRTLERLENANLFIVPLDDERRWYRYHHLFADSLSQRLARNFGTNDIFALHIRASEWHESSGLEIDAFRHAAAASDIARAERLLEGKGMPLLFRGAVAPIMHWLSSLPSSTLDERPSLWVTYASAFLFVNQLSRVEPKLQAAEAALQGVEQNEMTKDLIGRIATIRATVAVSQHQADVIEAEASRALVFLHPSNLPVRTATTWTLGYAYQLQGNRAAAGRAYSESISISKSIGHHIILIMASIGLGTIQESENQLEMAEQTYRGVIQAAGDPPNPVVCEAYLGLARISYERNDLEAAERFARTSIQLAPLVENTDRFVASELFLARIKLATKDFSGAAAVIAKADQYARQHNFAHQISEVAAAQVLLKLRQGYVADAASLAQACAIPIAQARVKLAQGYMSSAIQLLESLRQQAEQKGYADDRLKVLILLAVAQHAHGDKVKAIERLREALMLSEPSGFVRSYVDEGPPMAQLLSEAASRGLKSDYIRKLQAAMEAEQGENAKSQPLVEPLSSRELEVLQLIAQGFSNQEISERLFLALSSVKGHNQNIFGKLQVQRRTEAVARARELGLI